MAIDSAVEFLEQLQKFPGIDKFQRLHALLGEFSNPHEELKCVHIAGTNGKGSVSAMTASVLKEAGYKVGLFTSPHIQSYTERIKINGRNISDEKFESYMNKLKGVVEKLTLEKPEMSPGIFEALFVIAMKYFQDEDVDIVVVEAGVGGLNDTTNVVNSVVSIITNVALDHTHILGETVEEIARKKAGIIRENGYVITASSDEKVLEVLSEEAQKKNAWLIVAEKNDIDVLMQSSKGSVFHFMKYENLEIPLLGEHQMINAATTIMALQVLGKTMRIDANALRLGLRNVEWPLRLEIVNRDPLTILDGAHNPHGIKAACKAINEIFKNKEKILVIGMSDNKDCKEIVAHALSLNPKLVITTQASYCGLDPEIIKKCIENCESQEFDIITTKRPGEALKYALEKANSSDAIVCLGGLYVAAEARQYLLG